MKTVKLLIFFLCSLSCFASHLSEKDVWTQKKKFFQENGYLILKQFFSQGQTDLLRCWAEEIASAAEKMISLTQNTNCSLQMLAQTMPGALIVVPERSNPKQACRAEDLLTCYPALHHFISGTLTSYLSCLMDEPYVLFKDKINFKWPGGGAFPPHQDFPAYEFFGPREHITAMVCIDPATLENGCLQVAKHWTCSFAEDPTIDPIQLKEGKAVLPYVIGGPTHGSIQPSYSQQIEWLALEMNPGDVVLISSYIPHYSEPNRSSASRRAMFFTHNRLVEGDHRTAYYYTKRQDPDNPAFHFATPTKARSKD